MTFVALKPIITRVADISLDENNIIHVIVHADVRVDYEDAIDVALVIKNLGKNKPTLKLIDLRLNGVIEKKAQKLIDSKEIKQKTIARAVILGSFLSSIAKNFFMKMNKPETPTKIFTNYDEAYAWLLSIKKEEG